MAHVQHTIASVNAGELRKFDLHGTPEQGLAGATAGFFAGFAAVSVLGPAAVQLNETLQPSAVALGFLVAAPQLTGSVLRIPFGAWVERAGGVRPMLVLLLASLLGVAGLIFVLACGPTTYTYSLLLVSGALCGCGVASFSVAIPQVAYWFPRAQQGRVLGITGGLGNLAPGCLALLLPFAFDSLGLVSTYAVWFVTLAVVIAAYAFWARDAFYFQLVRQRMAAEDAARIAREHGQELSPVAGGGALDGLRMAARCGDTWALVALYFTSFGGFLALVVWLPTYAVAFYGLDPREAGILTALAFAFPSSLVRIYGGALSDRYGGERVALTSFVGIMIGAATLAAATEVVGGLAGIGLLAISMGTANAAVFGLVPRRIPDAIGAASGWVGGVGAFGGFVLPPLLGAFVDGFGHAGYAWGFGIYVALAASCVALIQFRFSSGPRGGMGAESFESFEFDAS